jgi:fibronectin type 3 domain-containing protein
MRKEKGEKRKVKREKSENAKNSGWRVKIACLAFLIFTFSFLICCGFGGSIESLRPEAGGGEPSIPVPGSVRASALSSDNIQINWNSVKGAMNYKVYRNNTASGTYQLIATRTDTSYTDLGLTPLTTYYYRVSAVTANGEGEQSEPVYATSLAEGVVPAPGGLQASPLGSNSIQLSWNAVPEAIGYRIYRSDFAGGSYILAGTSTTTSYTNTGLSPSTLYYYKVSTVHSKGESGQSSPISAMTSAETPVQSPIGLNASALGSSSIQVTWSSVSGATGYRVYRSNSAGGVYNFLDSTSALSYTDSGLSAGTAYYYKVSSVKNSQESAMSSSYASATTQTEGGTIDYPPTMPTGLVVSSASSGSITLSWNSVSTANSYNVYRSITQTGAEAKINSNTVTGTSYTDNVPTGASYYYKVTGVNGSGESPKSAGAFAFAASHYTLSYYSGSQLLSLAAGSKHYYRMTVNSGQQYTIQWQDGGNIPQNVNSSIRVSAWQNDGTSIFSDIRYDGYTNPKVFTATASGYVTVEVNNASSSTSYNYQIYYF